MSNSADIRTIVYNLDQQIMKASSQFDLWVTTGDEWDEPDWLIETGFLQLMTGLEALGLPELRRIVQAEYTEIKNSDKGFSETGKTPDEEPYSPILGRLRRFLMAVRVQLPSDKHTTVTRDLLEIIRNIHYSITDEAIFSNVPRNEKESTSAN